MRSREFSKVLASLRGLNPRQLAVLSGQVETLNGQHEIQSLVAQRQAHQGSCPHCASPAFSRWGCAGSGEQRYRCKSCRKSFTGLTGTALCAIHYKDLLLENARCMKQALSVRKTAAVLGVHRNTAFRYRLLMMPLPATQQPSELTGIVEADETFFRKSYKGQKKAMPRKARKRGTRASKRGISGEQVAVLTAVSRGSRGSHITVLPAVPTGVAIGTALAPAMSEDSVLCSDSANAYKTAARSMGVTLHQIPKGVHKLGPFHIQNVNALHSRIKGWMQPFRGVATKNLAAYLAWFRFFDQAIDLVKPRQLLLNAFGVPSTNTI